MKRVIYLLVILFPIINNNAEVFAQKTKEPVFAEAKYNCYNNIWSIGDSITYAYDAKNNLSEKLIQTWDRNRNALLNDMKHTYTYDEKNNLILDFEQLVVDKSKNTFVNWVKHIYTYDQNNNKITHIRQKSYMPFTDFVDENKNVYSYDTKNNLISDSAFIMGTKGFENQNLDTYTYDTKNNQITSTQQYWDNTSKAFKNHWKFVSTYDAKNNKTSFLQQLAEKGMPFENYIKWTYAYDAKNNLITETQQDWNKASKTFKPRGKKTYAYDAGNKRIKENSSENKYTYTYNNKNDLKVELHQILNEKTKVFVDRDITHYYYSIQGK